MNIFGSDHAFVVGLLTLARLLGLIVLLPIAHPVGIRFRCVLALLLTLLILPLNLSQPIPHAQSQISLLAYSLPTNVLIGLMLSMVVQLWFAAFTCVGNLVGKVAGLGFQDIVLADQTQGCLGAWFYWFGTLCFFLTNSHHVVLAGILDSFQECPVVTDWSQQGIEGFTISIPILFFQASIEIALPLLAIQLLATILLGIVGRVLPTISGFGVFFGAQITLVVVGLLLLSSRLEWLHGFSIVNAIRFVLAELSGIPS